MGVIVVSVGLIVGVAIASQIGDHTFIQAMVIAGSVFVAGLIALWLTREDRTKP